MTVSRGTGQIGPATAGPIVSDVVFSEAVTGLTAAEVSLGRLEPPLSPPAATISGSGPALTVSVSFLTTAGGVG